MSPLPTDPDALIQSFCESWSRGDAEEMASYFADDAVYHNIPMEPVVSRTAIHEFFVGFLAAATDLSFDVHHQVASGNVVMNERTDTMTIGGKTVALPVAGVFEVADGRIVGWRDYFDMAQFLGT